MRKILKQRLKNGKTQKIASFYEKKTENKDNCKTKRRKKKFFKFNRFD